MVLGKDGFGVDNHADPGHLETQDRGHHNRHPENPPGMTDDEFDGALHKPRMSDSARTVRIPHVSLSLTVDSS